MFAYAIAAGRSGKPRRAFAARRGPRRKDYTADRPGSAVLPFWEDIPARRNILTATTPWKTPTVWSAWPVSDSKPHRWTCCSTTCAAASRSVASVRAKLRGLI